MRGLVVASNRGPVSWHLEDDILVPRRGSGGLVTALGGALQTERGTWVSVALSEQDRQVAAEQDRKPFTVDVDGGQYRLTLLDAGERFDPYYNEVSNRLLWFTVHTLWGEPYEPSGVGWRSPWEDGYLPTNELVGEAVAEAAHDGAEVYLQDYHLCAAGPAVRRALPGAPMLHYIHTPWVEPSLMGRLPDAVASGVVEGLLAADVIGFSSPDWCAAFRRCAEWYAGGRIDGSAVLHERGRTEVASFTLGVDEPDLAAVADSVEVREADELFDAEFEDRLLVVRVDRTDLSKNILRGLHAYELLLEHHPGFRGRVTHYAHLNPSRQSVPEYRAYLEACLDVAGRIRQRFGEDAIEVFVGDNFPRAVAALRRYDVLLTNPVVDGTNLVAKEGPTLNARDGALVLSRDAGAAKVLSEGALLVNPHDVEETAAALHRALSMDPAERATRARLLREASRIGAPDEWFAAQREALRRAVSARS